MYKKEEYASSVKLIVQIYNYVVLNSHLASLLRPEGRNLEFIKFTVKLRFQKLLVSN